jgi:hypothetical protein
VAAEERIKRPLLKFMLSLVLRHSIKKALVRDNFTEGVLKHFAIVLAQRFRQLVILHFSLKNGRMVVELIKRRTRATALCLTILQKSLLVLGI